ncbi:hypothetical protein [Dyadobacter sp. CY312]|uniref:hypothetical protein n=1 Tax=Dyadobacter sp. CY312 TaxID=2907303 RepID=UPI001F2B15EC|nr:hypothetical protein [Dyadobacter sp. CY312]MCE7039742.1 hypothetical protein [Dyadobacter sp. CY312]
MKSKKSQIEEILLKFSSGYSKAQSVDEIYSIFYPPLVDVSVHMSKKFEKAGMLLVSAEQEVVVWLEVNPKIGRLDPVPFLYDTKAFVGLDGHYFGNIVRVEASAEEVTGLKFDAIADLLIQKIKMGKFE